VHHVCDDGHVNELRAWGISQLAEDWPLVSSVEPTVEVGGPKIGWAGLFCHDDLPGPILCHARATPTGDGRSVAISGVGSEPSLIAQSKTGVAVMAGRLPEGAQRVVVSAPGRTEAAGGCWLVAVEALDDAGVSFGFEDAAGRLVGTRYGARRSFGFARVGRLAP
jgi:hypothetical protein